MMRKLFHRRERYNVPVKLLYAVHLCKCPEKGWDGIMKFLNRALGGWRSITVVSWIAHSQERNANYYFMCRLLLPLQQLYILIRTLTANTLICSQGDNIFISVFSCHECSMLNVLSNGIMQNKKERTANEAAKCLSIQQFWQSVHGGINRPSCSHDVQSIS